MTVASDNNLQEAGEGKTVASVVGLKPTRELWERLGFPAWVDGAAPGDPTGTARHPTGKASCPGGVLLSGEGLQTAGWEGSSASGVF